jgi:hypothetical protein
VPYDEFDDPNAAQEWAGKRSVHDVASVDSVARAVKDLGLFSSILATAADEAGDAAADFPDPPEEGTPGGVKVCVNLGVPGEMEAVDGSPFPTVVYVEPVQLQN